MFSVSRAPAFLVLLLAAAPAAAFDAAALRQRLAPLAVLDAPVPELGASAASGHFLDAGDLDVVRNFPAPPAPGSALDRADFVTLHRWQDSRSQAECSRAQSEAHASYETLFGSVSPFPLPLGAEAKAFFTAVAADAGAASVAVKNRYRRQRPFLRDTTLNPCIERAGGFAYPSGHATLARVYARALADLDPGRASDYRARGDEAALDRVIGGVHHPSDIEAGKTLGDGVYEALKRIPGFNAELESLRRTLPGVGLLSAQPGP